MESIIKIAACTLAILFDLVTQDRLLERLMTGFPATKSTALK